MDIGAFSKCGTSRWEAGGKIGEVFASLQVSVTFIA